MVDIVALSKSLKETDVNKGLDVKGFTVVSPAGPIDDGIRLQKHVLHTPKDLTVAQIEHLRSLAGSMIWEDVPPSDTVYAKGSISGCIYLRAETVHILVLDGTGSIPEKVKQFPKARSITVHNPGPELPALLNFDDLERLTVYGTPNHPIQLNRFTSLRGMQTLILHGPIDSYPLAECMNEKTQLILMDHSGTSPLAFIRGMHKSASIDRISVRAISNTNDVNSLIALGAASEFRWHDQLPANKCSPWTESKDHPAPRTLYQTLHLLSPNVAVAWLSHSLSTTVNYTKLASFGLCIPVYDNVAAMSMLDGQTEPWRLFWRHLCRNTVAPNLRRVDLVIPPGVSDSLPDYTKIVIDSLLVYVASSPASITPFEVQLVLSPLSTAVSDSETADWCTAVWNPFISRLALTSQTRIDRLYQMKQPEVQREAEWLTMNGLPDGDSATTTAASLKKRAVWFDFELLNGSATARATVSKHSFTIKFQNKPI